VNTSTSPDRPVLSVERLTIDFGPRRVVDELSFALQRGRTLCIAGESGSGKSLTSLAIMGLLPRAASVPGGAIIFEGRDLLGLPERQLQPLRGKRLGLQLSEILTLIDMYDSPGDTEVQLRQYLSVLEQHRATLEQQRRDIEDTLQEIAQQERDCRALLAKKP